MLVIRPVDSIDEVARKMLERSTDGAVVVDGGFVVGVFTTTDVLRFISDFFDSRKDWHRSRHRFDVPGQ